MQKVIAWSTCYWTWKGFAGLTQQMIACLTCCLIRMGIDCGDLLPRHHHNYPGLCYPKLWWTVATIVVVMINIVPVPVVDNYIVVPSVIMASVIASMTIVMVTAIYSHCHNSCKSKPGRIISIIVRRHIWNIGRRIHVLYNGSGLNNHCSRCCRVPSQEQDPHPYNLGSA